MAIIVGHIDLPQSKIVLLEDGEISEQRNFLKRFHD